MDSGSLRNTVIAGLVAVAGLYALNRSRKHSSLPLPPGPKPWPLIGNLLDIPKEKQWLRYHALCEQYGDVLYLEALGKKIVVLDSLDAVNDLMDRRSATYSDRPEAPMLELMGFEWMLSRVKYGDKWRRERRMMHAHVHPNAARVYQDNQLRAAQQFALKLMDEPSDLAQKVRACIGATIIELVYGIRVSSMRDPYINLPERAAYLLNLGAIPGMFMVNFFPALKYLPAWFPGAGFKRTATEARVLHQKMRTGPLEVVKERMESGIDLQCIAQDMLQDAAAEDPEIQSSIRNVTGSVYLAGSDTTVAATLGFFLGLVVRPEVQSRAQAEIEAVVGHERLPTFDDLERLPYVSAVISESLRWQPVTPMAAPHTSTEDEEYRGYLIPKGTAVLGNAWAILHDPEAYPEPLEFKPERFLKVNESGTIQYSTDVRDPRVACFGFGRRICPGRYVAEQSLFAMIVTALATLDVSPIKDAAGVPQIPIVDVTPYHLSHPKPFAYHIKPRGQYARELLEAQSHQPR